MLDLLKKIHHTQSVSTDNYRFGPSGLLPMKVKKKKSNVLFICTGLASIHFTSVTTKDKHTMILLCSEEICSNYSFWFYKKKNNLSGVRRCPELDMCTLYLHSVGHWSYDEVAMHMKSEENEKRRCSD